MNGIEYYFVVMLVSSSVVLLGCLVYVLWDVVLQLSGGKECLNCGRKVSMGYGYYNKNLHLCRECEENYKQLIERV